VEHHFADRFLEDVGRTIDAEHAVDEHADAVGHPLDVAQNVRAEQNRAALPLDDLDHRFEKIAADDRVETERRIVEDQQLGIGRDGQSERDLGPLSVGEPP